MDKRIVYTRFDGGVSVCCPSDECIAWMTGGGGIWDDRPRGFLDIQVERMIAAGHGADASLRFAKAVQFGGCTTAEALEIIRDRDCAHLGTAIELWDVDDVPTDRWFRDAWRRSHNGGPISVDLRLARPIHFRNIRSLVEEENRKRASDLFSFEIKPDWSSLRERIKAAREVDELRQIWPREFKEAA